MFSKALWENLKTFIPSESYPALPCPYCNAVQLRLSTETLKFKVVPYSDGNFVVNRHNSDVLNNFKNATNSNNVFEVLMNGLLLWDSLKYDPGKFLAFMECNECLNAVAVTGSAIIPKSHVSRDVKIAIKGEHFSPPLPIFAINENIPQAVIQELLRSFNYFHSDLPASGVMLRRAIEQMCSELGFKEKTLHRSIELLSARYPEEGAWLQALKLVGNEATHSSGIDEQDLLHSFKIFSAALDIFRRKKMSEDVAITIPKIKQKFGN